MQIGPAMGTYGAIMFVSLRQYFLVVETFDKYFMSEFMLANKFKNARFCLNWLLLVLPVPQPCNWNDQRHSFFNTGLLVG